MQLDQLKYLVLLSTAAALPFWQKLLILLFTIEEISVARDFSICFRKRLRAAMEGKSICQTIGDTVVEHPSNALESRLLSILPPVGTLSHN
jgi:hypothetical protein